MLALAVFLYILGFWFLISALANWDWIYALHEYAAIEAVFGEGTTRWVCGFEGLAIIALGVTCF